MHIVMEVPKPSNSIDWGKYWGGSPIEIGSSRKKFWSFGELPSDQRIEAERLLWARTSFSELIVNFPNTHRTSDNPLNEQKNIMYADGGKRINLCFGPTNEPSYWIGIKGIENDVFLVTDTNGKSEKKPKPEVFSAVLSIIEEVSYWGE